MKNKLNFISFLLLIGALAASHSRSIKKKNMTQALCVGAKWLQVGSVRFWQRKSCDKRRQYGPRQATANGEEEKEPEDTAGTSRMPSTLNLDELLPSLEAGPVRGPKYSPNFGYEPYWPKGDWVFDRDDGTKDKNIYMCGVRCPKVYTEFGKICGRNKYGGYKTFPNYCQLKNEDCSNIQRWKALYRGECFRDIRVYKDKHTRYYINIQKDTRSAISYFMSVYTADKNVGFCTDCTSRYRIDYRKK